MLQVYPNATITARSLALVSVIGSDLTEVSVLLRGLQALQAADIPVHAAQQGLRKVEVQFLVPCDALNDSTKALHTEFVFGAQNPARLAT